MKQDKTTGNFSIYDIEEEEEYLKITHSYDLKSYVVGFLISHILTVIIGYVFVLMFVIRPEQFIQGIIICGIVLVFCLTVSISWHSGNFSYMKYRLVLNRRGIKNVTARGEVFIPWEKLAAYGKEPVTIKGYRNRKHTVVYFSTEEFDEKELSKIITSEDSEFYENSTGFIIIALMLPEEYDVPNFDEEISRLYEKIDTYVKLHKIDSQIE